VTVFSLKLEILPAPQLAVWPLLSQVPREFVLYGGTSLALRLGHRQSVDFDFFSSKDFDPKVLMASIPFLEGGTIAQSERNALSVWLRPISGSRTVKMSFFGGLKIPVLAKPTYLRSNQVVLASILDLAGTKAKVINQRVELKDYLDIAAFLDYGMTLPKIVAAAVALYPGMVTDGDTTSAITYFEEERQNRFRKRSRRSCGQQPEVPRLPRLPCPSTRPLERHMLPRDQPRVPSADSGSISW
jgi:hypothetical protein